MAHLKYRKVVAALIVSFHIASAALLVEQVQAVTITIDPGAVGSTFSYQNFDFFDLSGTRYNGQTLSVDVLFADNKFLVGSSVPIELFVNQSGSVGTSPTTGFSVTAHLLDAVGDPVGVSVGMPLNVQMPAQIWPGWPYYLPDGTQYLPPTTGYGASFSGRPTHITPNGYDIAPIIFSGIHFDITLPDSPSDTIIGSRLQLANFSTPIYVSPSPLPEFHVNVADTSSTLLLLSYALVGLGGLRQKLGNR
jgi:hypothetical protein